ERLARLVAQDRVLGWFPQRDVDEAGAFGQAAVPLEDPAGGFDLLRRQRLQRMPYLHPDVLSRRHHPLLPGSRSLAGPAHAPHTHLRTMHYGRFSLVIPQTNWCVKGMNSSFTAR